MRPPIAAERRASNTSEDLRSSTKAGPLVAQDEISPLSDGHADLLRLWFGLQAWLGVIAGGLLVLQPITGHRVTIHGNPWIVIPVAALSTWAAFLTRRLLAERELAGVWMSAVTFGCGFAGCIATGHFGTGAIISGIGFVLTGSVWRGFRSAEAVLPPSEGGEA